MDDQILEKPVDKQDAYRMLSRSVVLSKVPNVYIKMFSKLFTDSLIYIYEESGGQKFFNHF